MTDFKQDKIPYYLFDSPYDIAYRKDCPSYPVVPHTHNGAELYLTLTPLPDVLLDDKVCEVAAGNLIVIPPYCIHQLYHEPNVFYERYILSINTDWLKPILPASSNLLSILENSSTPLIYPLEKEALSQYLHLLQPFLSDFNRFTFSQMADFFLLLDFLDTRIKKDGPFHMQPLLHANNAQRRINEMIAYINDHLYDNLCLDDLSKHFYLNSDYLSRLFKQHMHITISHYMTLQKINHAQSLLRKGTSISEIQELLGYSSYAHFSKTFKKITGITPGRYKCQFL